MNILNFVSDIVKVGVPAILLIASSIVYIRFKISGIL